MTPPPEDPRPQPLNDHAPVGGWADPDANAGRHYTRADLGHMCPVCRHRLPAAIDDEHTHPCCGPDAAALLTQARAATRPPTDIAAVRAQIRRAKGKTRT